MGLPCLCPFLPSPCPILASADAANLLLSAGLLGGTSAHADPARLGLAQTCLNAHCNSPGQTQAACIGPGNL